MQPAVTALAALPASNPLLVPASEAARALGRKAGSPCDAAGLQGRLDALRRLVL
jgi:hypothetical protein